MMVQRLSDDPLELLCLWLEASRSQWFQVLHTSFFWNSDFSPLSCTSAQGAALAFWDSDSQDHNCHI